MSRVPMPSLSVLMHQVLSCPGMLDSSSMAMLWMVVLTPMSLDREG